MQINTAYHGSNLARAAANNYEQANSLVAIDVNGLVVANHRPPRFVESSISCRITNPVRVKKITRPM